MTTSERQAALIARCARQRAEAAVEVRALLHPVSSGMGFRLPMTIAGVVLGLIATRSGRAMPMLTAGLSLWKLIRNLLRK
jgi:hypothetical protein